MSTDPPFEPLDPRGAVLGEEVFTVLGEAIRDGRLRPGERVRDVDLAARLGISRTPVREALQRLERIGLVEVAANRYTRVSTPDERALADTQQFMTHIVGDSLRIALPRCDDETLAAILAELDNTIEVSLTEDATELLVANARFFQQAIRATGNAVFVSVMREAGFALQRNVVGWTPEIPDRDERDACYRRLRDAVARRDAEAAERHLMTLHAQL
ncbi:GntR family transcriptional regulator [Microbacterium sp. CJ88]|uniref:GntR family transcriptional regulator n=1 Tax=Microbacterium sp. CJ88 TaxID=3445672 RepID=UPI003F65E3DA